MLRHKIKTLNTLKPILQKLKLKKKKIVFTNGCYDLLHIGHIRILERCKTLGDCLVLALNSDASVRRIKGRGRPVIPEHERAEICAGLEPVDYVILFNEDTPARVINELKPDILVKGGDWKAHTIVGRDAVKKVVRFPLVKGRSTSSIIKKILRNYVSCPQMRLQKK